MITLVGSSDRLFSLNKPVAIRGPLECGIVLCASARAALMKHNDGLVSEPTVKNEAYFHMRFIPFFTYLSGQEPPEREQCVFPVEVCRGVMTSGRHSTDCEWG